MPIKDFSAHVGFWQLHVPSGRLTISKHVATLLGLVWHRDLSIELQQALDAIHPDDHDRVSQSIQQARETGVHDIEHRIIRPDGEVRWVHELAGFRNDSEQQIMIGTVRDVTEQKIYQSELERLNMTDELTKVHNRRYFISCLDKRVQQVTPHSKVCVAIIDIDHFKVINDQFGHAQGDIVLQSVAEFIQQQLRPGDVFARIGGEEFALILHRVEGADAKRRLNAIRQLMSGIEFHHQGQSYHVSATIGMTMLHVQDTRDDVLHRADEALYEGKRAGRNCVVYSNSA